MAAYYNEFDPQAAAWLRELIAKGHIAPGLVDERSIEDVKPDDLKEFTQCHFFAGIGVWSYALRRAGWDDSRPVWTASCPCQPFSTAGNGAGFDDSRHLWPYFSWLAQELRPAVIFGEQVANPSVGPWIDLVQTNLEAMDYAFGAVPFPSASVGAPHIRDRIYWVSQGMGNTESLRQSRERGEKTNKGERGASERSGISRLANGDGDGCNKTRKRQSSSRSDGAFRDCIYPARESGANQVNGFWKNSDWLRCADGRWRPVEPGTFPLVNGASSRVVRLRGYGNAINAEAAKIFIEAVMGV